jgi:hypothetical protein
MMFVINQSFVTVPCFKLKIHKMKNPVALFLLLFIPAVLNGQGIGLGIKAGANFANQEIENISAKTVTDYLVGAYLNINFTEKFGITPEVLYTAYGSKWNDVKVNFDYLAIPIMLRYKPINFLSIEAGPQFSFLTRATQTNMGSIMDQLKNNDFGLGFGAGLHLPLGFNVGARYVLGFMNISSVSGQSIKNRTFQLYAGWTFLGKR